MAKYVIVTAISQFRQRYAIPVDELKKLNLEVQPTDDDLHEWARDCVTMEQIKEFSQHHIGESIIDSVLVDEDQMLEQFDQDNQYLKSWPREYKLEWVNNWKEDWFKEPNEEHYHEEMLRKIREETK